jgi:hypothetical protein
MPTICSLQTLLYLSERERVVAKFGAQVHRPDNLFVGVGVVELVDVLHQTYCWNIYYPSITLGLQISQAP